MGSLIISSAAAVVLLLFVLCGFPRAHSKPVITDPYRCLDRDPDNTCCPRRSRVPMKIVDFKPPPQSEPLRVRRPAHALDPEAARKYEKATALMRLLPEEHPWSFIRQAKVHCSYCSGGHLHLGLNVSLEIHNSWHFYTWHRAYLYFYERILGKLIKDTTFALPFWNWDDPKGMSIPLIYRDNSSSLFNPTRYPSAINFTDLGGCEGNNTPSSLPTQKQCNLQVMHRQFVAAFNSTLLFYGSPYRAGDSSSPGGSPIESSPHGSIHVITGSELGRIATAARDPLFFAHHANVDRLWAIWESIPGRGSKVIEDRDFLDASFLFWNENMELVRIMVRDVIDTRNLGYVYENVSLLWMNIKTEVEDDSAVSLRKRDRVEEDAGGVQFPVVLRSEVRSVVERKPGTKGEMLVVSGIEMDGRDYVWFKVYLGRVVGGRAEVGCFIHMERRAKEKIPIVTSLRIGITEVLEELSAAGDDQLVVTLTPKIGGDRVTIGGLSIMQY